MVCMFYEKNTLKIVCNFNSDKFLPTKNKRNRSCSVFIMHRALQLIFVVKISKDVYEPFVW